MCRCVALNRYQVQVTALWNSHTSSSRYSLLFERQHIQAAEQRHTCDITSYVFSLYSCTCVRHPIKVRRKHPILVRAITDHTWYADNQATISTTTTTMIHRYHQTPLQSKLQLVAPFSCFFFSFSNALLWICLWLFQVSAKESGRLYEPPKPPTLMPPRT